MPLEQILQSPSIPYVITFLLSFAVLFFLMNRGVFRDNRNISLVIAGCIALLITWSLNNYTYYFDSLREILYDLEVNTQDHTYTIEDVIVHNSAAGSLLCYCLKITDVDPIKHHLFFERFLNEAREDVPDIDIDFAPDGRDPIKDYIIEKWNGRVENES